METKKLILHICRLHGILLSLIDSFYGIVMPGYALKTLTLMKVGTLKLGCGTSFLGMQVSYLGFGTTDALSS